MHSICSSILAQIERELFDVLEAMRLIEGVSVRARFKIYR